MTSQTEEPQLMSTAPKPVVALPETRLLDVLAGLLERRGVDVVRCPLVAIKDSPDPAGVLAWIDRLCNEPMDLLIVYTGEGIRRLAAAADAAGREAAFVAALGRTPLLTRGPKPVRTLRELGVVPEHAAAEPTTAGIIETLGAFELDGKRVGIQLYGAESVPALTDYLLARGAALDCVAPYVYASELDDAAVVALIDRLANREIDAIAFTSKAQVERLADVARRHSCSERLRRGLEAGLVAAVGPVVAAELEELGVDVDVIPESGYFMKPMVTALMSRLATETAAESELGDAEP
jgi:uroporphyrinogen-III synthase